MQYSKETEKFSFGIGTEEMIGSGRVTDIVSAEKNTKSQKQEILELVLGAAAGLFITLFRLKSAGKKKKKKRLHR